MTGSRGPCRNDGLSETSSHAVTPESRPNSLSAQQVERGNTDDHGSRLQTPIFSPLKGKKQWM